MMDQQKVIRNIIKKGFKKDTNTKLEKRKRSTNHNYYFFYYKNKRTNILTYSSHGKKEMYDDLISKMSDQLYLSKHDFIEFASCRYSEEKYIAILKKNHPELLEI